MDPCCMSASAQISLSRLCWESPGSPPLPPAQGGRSVQETVIPPALKKARSGSRGGARAGETEAGGCPIAAPQR